jgi:hypothetical protein
VKVSSIEEKLAVDAGRRAGREADALFDPEQFFGDDTTKFSIDGS